MPQASPSCLIFAHAPVIVPSVLGRPLPFNRSFSLPLAMLHVTLLLRLVGGDAMHNKASWQWGGSLNEVALLLFVALAASAVASTASTRTLWPSSCARSASGSKP